MFRKGHIVAPGRMAAFDMETAYIIHIIVNPQ